MKEFMMLKKILLLSFFGVAVVSTIIRFSNKDLYAGYVYNITPQVEFLNQALAQKYGDKYKIYAAGFNPEENIPDIGENNPNAILWLGRQPLKITPDMPRNFNKFGTVLTSDFNKLIFRDIFKKEMYQFPEFIINSPPRIESVPQLYALIGNPQYAKEYLKKHNLQYKQYSYKNIEDIRKDIPQLKAIIIEQKKAAYNMDTTLLEAIANGIIVCENRVDMITSSQALVGETIEYYFNNKELADIINKLEQNQYEEKKEFDKNWQQAFFSKEAALKRLEAVLQGKTYRELDKSWVNVYIRNQVGFHPAGDTWLAKDMIKKLNPAYKYYLTFEDTTYRPRAAAQILLVGRINNIEQENTSDNGILWLAFPHISKGGQTTFNEYMEEVVKLGKHFAAIAVSSQKMHKYLLSKRIAAVWIPQFTNIGKFYPDYDASKKSDILFVGNNHFERKITNLAKKYDMPVTIYGKWWPKGWATAEYVDNRILRQYYSSAKIVLSDQNAYMKDFGVIVNRIFDATACKTLVISEYVEAVAEVYGDCVPMYKTEKEFVDLVNYYLEHEDERRQKAECAYEITLKNFTSDIAAQKFNTIIEEVHSASK